MSLVDSCTTFRHLMRGARAVLFDCYNTLVVDEYLPMPIWQHLSQLGYFCTPDIERIFEPDAFDGTVTPKSGDVPDHTAWRDSNLRKLLAFSGVPDSRVECTLRILLDAQSGFTSKPAPAAPGLVKTLRNNGYRVGICSNWETPIEPFLERTGLDCGLFDTIVTSAVVGARKPHELIFRVACERLGVPTDETVHVGDNWSADVAGSVRAGLSAVWLRMHRPSRGLLHRIPEFESLAELKDALTSFMGEGNL